MPGMEGVPGMPDMGGMPGMGDGMPGGMPGMPGGGGPAIRINADVTARFDTGAGKLLGMQGTIGTTVSIGGMGQVKTSSQFLLKRR
jgi:hypothetical protein